MSNQLANLKALEEIRDLLAPMEASAYADGISAGSASAARVERAARAARWACEAIYRDLEAEHDALAHAAPDYTSGDLLD